MSKKRSFNSKYPRAERIGTCSASNKIQYATEQEAHKDAKRLRKGRKTRLKSYRCKFCNAWHNGHDRPASGRDKTLTPKMKHELYKSTPKVKVQS